MAVRRRTRDEFRPDDTGSARTVLHGGSAGAWYFDWFRERYPTSVERHIGVEAFAERPATLPDGVAWLHRSLGDLEPVSDGEVDLVFAGQVIEHLWPEEITGFLTRDRHNPSAQSAPVEESSELGEFLASLADLGFDVPPEDEG